MSGSIPCPVCGAETGPADEGCRVCGFALRYARESNAGGSKCARCGSAMPSGFDFCPVCGQDQRARMRRPPTAQLRIHPAPVSQEIASAPAPVHAATPSPNLTVPAPSHAAAMFAQAPMGASPMPPRPVATADRTVPAPGLGAQPMPAMQPFVSSDRTVPAPGLGSGSGPRRSQVGKADLPFSPFDAPTGPRMDEMPAIVAPVVHDEDPTERMQGHMLPKAPVSETDLTVPAAGRKRVGDDDKTIPVGHPRARDVAAVIAANPFPETERTRPDRPGEFSGGPTGQAPSPTVNVPRPGPGMRPDPAPPSAARFAASHVPVASGQGVARLVIVGRDGSEGESFPFTAATMTVGRSHGELLFPEDPFLSPTHVTLQRMPDGTIVLVDTGSSNGVYLRIRGSSPVYPGDLFMIGHQLLRLENLDGQVNETPAGLDGTRMFGTPLPPAWGRLSQIGRGGVAGDHFYLRGARVVLGREDGDLVFPNDPYVSRAHACLRLEITGHAMSVYLEDLKSANGTYVRIRGSARIGSMDTFRIGDQILRLRID